MSGERSSEESRQYTNPQRAGKCAIDLVNVSDALAYAGGNNVPDAHLFALATEHGLVLQSAIKGLLAFRACGGRTRWSTNELFESVAKTTNQPARPAISKH